MISSRLGSSRVELLLQEIKASFVRLEDRIVLLETRVIWNEGVSKGEVILFKATITRKIAELEAQIRDLVFHVSSLEKRIMHLFTDVAKFGNLAQVAYDGVYVQRFTRGRLNKR